MDAVLTIRSSVPVRIDFPVNISAPFIIKWLGYSLCEPQELPRVRHVQAFGVVVELLGHKGRGSEYLEYPFLVKA